MSPLNILMLGAAILLIYTAFHGGSPFSILKGIIPGVQTTTASNPTSTKNTK